MWSCPGNMPKYYPGLRDILPGQDHIKVIIFLLENGKFEFSRKQYIF